VDEREVEGEGKGQEGRAGERRGGEGGKGKGGEGQIVFTSRKEAVAIGQACGQSRVGVQHGTRH